VGFTRERSRRPILRAILLEQLFHEDKAVLREILFPTLNLSELSESRVSTEFPLSNGRRRADLAVHNRNDQLVALAEVKENDQLALISQTPSVYGAV
jgi:hypothetical protein